MPRIPKRPTAYVEAIRKSGLNIYAPIEIGDPELWIPTPDLEHLLHQALQGISLAGLPLRTRSKVLKEHVCRALRVPVPRTFKKTQPRFLGQQFDTYAQKSNNLQVWNEELAPSRRYVLLRVSSDDCILRVKVVTGDTLAKLDTTGTLTQKYQARFNLGDAATELITSSDTSLLAPFVTTTVGPTPGATPTADPQVGDLLPVAELFTRLSRLVGASFSNPGLVQERNRGAELHRLVCKVLGYASYHDAGQFPDVRHQLLEVKLQTAPTIDLGLVRPDSTEPLDCPHVGGQPIRHADVRYAIFYASLVAGNIQLTHLIVTTGERFFERFPQFQGKVLNKKLQIPLPSDFFEV